MTKRSITTFEEAVNYISDIPRFTSKSTMEDTKAFLHRLGDPDKQMKIIHVAGTNGKGSVCAYMRSVLETAGYKVGLFTSPHLVDIRERFIAGGEMISEEDFLRVFLYVYDMLWDENGGECGHPSYFEFLFFMAMVFFAEESPDFCILETGLGGRLDATNSVSGKELAVITHISLDHVEYLGDTVEKIAGEKAGILQAGAPVVYWDPGESISRVFEGKAAELGIKTYPVSKKDYSFLGFQNKSIDFSLHTEYYSCIRLSLQTIASYQMENATLAVRALEVLDRGRTISEEALVQGLRNCFWAGRMEEVLPDIYVDGAHNEDGIRAFLETVAEDGYNGHRTLLFSAVKDKDCRRMAEELAGTGLFDRIAVARLKTGRAASPEVLREMLEEYPECECAVYENTGEALRGLIHNRRQGERIYIAGSLYLVGEIKELLRYDNF